MATHRLDQDPALADGWVGVRFPMTWGGGRPMRCPREGRLSCDRPREFRGTLVPAQHKNQENLRSSRDPPPTTPCSPPRGAVFSLIPTSCLGRRTLLIGPQPTHPATLQILSYDSDLRNTCTQVHIPPTPHAHHRPQLSADRPWSKRIRKSKVLPSPSPEPTGLLLSAHRQLAARHMA